MTKHRHSHPKRAIRIPPHRRRRQTVSKAHRQAPQRPRPLVTPLPPAPQINKNQVQIKSLPHQAAINNLHPAPATHSPQAVQRVQPVATSKPARVLQTKALEIISPRAIIKTQVAAQAVTRIKALAIKAQTITRIKTLTVTNLPAVIRATKAHQAINLRVDLTANQIKML